MVRTTSTERDYRFFNFVFACGLYNVWRLVDLLVKLAIDGENGSYAPLVDANQFLTVGQALLRSRSTRLTPTRPGIRLTREQRHCSADVYFTL